jgi:hypothetical protein
MPDPRAQARFAAPDVFISYASDDVTRAAALHARLVAAGFAVWFDKARLAPGCDWHREIGAGCEAARVMLPLLTPAWKQSEWTRYETYSHDAVVPVVPRQYSESIGGVRFNAWSECGVSAPAMRAHLIARTATQGFASRTAD